MSGFIADIVGAKGVGYATGAVTTTPPGDKKIFGIGVIAEANITNEKYTPKSRSGVSKLDQVTLVSEWMGKALPPVGPTAYIPLDFDADSLALASGTIILYYR